MFSAEILTQVKLSPRNVVMNARSSARNLAVLGALVLAGAAPPGWTQTPPSGSGRLRGVVRDTAGAAIAAVRISVGSDTVRFIISDSAGAFDLSGIAAGLQRVHFRRLGFVPASFTVLVVAGEEQHVQVELAPLATRLEPVEVRESLYPGLAVSGFYDRLRQREQGLLSATFILPEEIERRRPWKVTDLLYGLPGINMENRVLWGRGYGRDGTRCRPAVFIDWLEYRSTEIDQVLSPFDVAAIEVYPSASGAPERFQSTRINRPCGSVVIWTKMGRNR